MKWKTVTQILMINLIFSFSKRYLEIIESCGGFYVEEIEDKSVDNKIVISCDQDKSSWAIWRNRDATLVSTEAILSGVLKQRFEPEKFKL